MTASQTVPKRDQIASPTTHFASPQDVLSQPGLTDAEKKKILDSWEEDARRLAVATEEGMGGGEPSRITEVAEAKAELGLNDKRPASPTKTG